ncbi:MAG: methyl-accepting chemotaxis protein [Pirellulales bacterium]|nr:methyl-accepting chemotaxis protein [Pirellulales bacterium]
MFALKKWSDWSIRARINAILLPAALPMIAVGVITYRSDSNSSEKTSQQMAQYIVASNARETDAMLTTQNNVFQKWTAEDIYGLAIEFNTLDELGKKFQEMTSAASQFSLIVLADPSGKVLLASSRDAGKSTQVATLKGTVLKEAQQLAQTTTRTVELIDTEALSRLGLGSSETFLFSYPSKDSSGKSNGVFLAYLNPSAVQHSATSTRDNLVQNGFPNARTLLVDTRTGQVVARSCVEGDKSQWSLVDEANGWLQDAANAGQTRTFDISGAWQYVTFATVMGPDQLASGENDTAENADGKQTAAASPLRLAVAVPSADVFARAKTVMWFNIGIVLAGGAFLMLIFWWTARSITKPLDRTILLLKDIAQGEGDLTKRLDASGKDELSRLARWFNTFVEKLQGIIRDVAVDATSVSTSSAELANTARAMAAGAQQMSSQSSAAASSAEEVSSSMVNMSASTEQMTANVKTVADAVREMTASISEIAKNAEQASSVAGNAAHLAQSSNENIGQLGTAADEIGKVIETIQDIAEQTNLLALNATIEAARAGDAGKGFAVVATEVKELAKQTAEATEDIRAKIEGIQTSAEEAVRSIVEISNVIQEVNGVSKTIAAAVEEQSATTGEIAKNISETSNAAQMVAAGVAESATATQTIAQNVTEMDEALKQTAEGANSTQAASGQLTEVATRLQQLVGQFQT